MAAKGLGSVLESTSLQTYVCVFWGLYSAKPGSNASIQVFTPSFGMKQFLLKLFLESVLRSLFFIHSSLAIFIEHLL